MEDHQVNVIVVKEEGSKSSNAINLLEDHVNVVKEEGSKSSNAINLNLLDLEDDVNVVKEESESSNAINLRYPNSDKERFKKVVVFLVVFCLLLSIFPALKIPWFHSKLMAQCGTFIMESLTFPIALFQMVVWDNIANHPVNSSIYSILYILLLSSVISFVEVSFVSWNAAIAILIFWLAIIAAIAYQNREEIYNVDIAVSNIIHIFISITLIVDLGYAIYCSIFGVLGFFFLVAAYQL